MNIKKFIRKILGSSKTPQESELEYLKAQGLQVGKNFRNHSEYAFDSLFPWLISVGDNVCISSNVKILAHDTSTEYVNGLTKIGIVHIGNNVYIGYNVIILCNVRIGSDVIIGAGSVVTTDIPDGTVYAGNPARYICNIDSFKKKHFEDLESHPIFCGPCKRWHELEIDEKIKMKDQLKDSFGYMK